MKEILKPETKLFAPRYVANAARSVESDPMQGFMFRLSIPELPTHIKFVTCSAINITVAPVEYYEGGQFYAYKLAGRASFSEITCTRGMYSDPSVEDLYKRILTNPAARTTITLEAMDRFGKVHRVWRLAEAWINAWQSADYDANSDDVAIESITIQYEYLLDR